MPSDMFKTLFQRAPFTELNKYINKKVNFYVYNISCIQLVIRRVTIQQKGIELPWNFFVLPRNGEHS